MRLMTKPIMGLVLGSILASAASTATFAQVDPTPTEPTAATESAAPAVGEPAKKPLAGKSGFTMDSFERTQFDEKAKAIQAQISKKRQHKIGMLEKLVTANRPTPKMADYIFRLAEAHWDESKYQYLLSRDKYDKEMTCFEEKRCSVEPAEPTENYSVALDYYRKVLREHPSYRRIDEVMYYLGRAALKAGKDRKDRQLQKEGVKRLQDLVQKYPQSRFVAQSHLALAEYYFETDSLFYAKTNYEKIITNHKRSPMYNYALYKLGWVYFNLTEFEKTVDTFKKVISTIGEPGSSGGAIEFRAQALNDLVVTWAELDNGWRDAREYFLKEVGEKETYLKLDKMAGLLVSKDKDEEAIDLYKHLIDHDSVSPNMVEYYSAILEVRRKIGDKTEIETEVNLVIDTFDTNGKWFISNKSNVELTDKADELVANNLQLIANDYHRAAEKLVEQRKPSMGSFKAAAKYYAMFLERFPDDKKSYRTNFYYAEILYDQLKDYEKAAEQYEKVIEKDTKGEFVEDAALGVIYSVERLMVKEGLRKEAKGGSIEIVEKEETVSSSLKDGDEDEIKKVELHPLERRYIAAADTYVALLRGALKDDAFRKKYPDRGAMIPVIMYIAADTFYKRGHFKDAVERLMVIFELYPQHKMANVAVNTIIDAYARLKRWEEIESWARKLIAAKNFKVKSRTELEQMIAIAKTEHARDLTKQRRFDEAIKVQQEIVDEFGRKNKKLASIALYNIGIIHEEARRFPEAVSTFEDVVKRYPKEDVAVSAQFEIGVLYENQTQFEAAAAAFMEMEKFKKSDKHGKKAQDAILNAGLIYEALEKYDEAHATFARYIKLFPSAEDVKVVAFRSAEVLEFKDESAAWNSAGKQFEKIQRSYGKKDPQYGLRAQAAAGRAYKRADKGKNRKKATKLFKVALKRWNKLSSGDAAKDLEPGTKAYAGMAALELAEYTYDDYAALSIDAINKRDKFDVGLLKKTLVAKAEALQKAAGAFSNVLDFRDPGMAAAAAFRLGQLQYEFAQSLYNAPVPPGLSEEDVDEYRYQLEVFAAPIEEKALIAFTLALKQALEKNVYNKWSRLSAEYAAKVNEDEFPISTFAAKPNKTKDTLQSTNFIRVLRDGDTVVDFTE